MDIAAVQDYLRVGVQVLLIVVLFYLALTLRNLNDVTSTFKDSVESVEKAAEEVEKEVGLLEYLPFGGGNGD